MENNAIPEAPIAANTKPVACSRWNRELTGRSGRSYIHGASQLLMQSYMEIGAVPHKYHILASPCPTYTRHSRTSGMVRMIYDEPYIADELLNHGVLPIIQLALSGLGISAMEFNTKGTYLASVTRSGCLSVHRYESLYNHNQGEDEKEPARHCHFLDYQGMNAVRWNPINQAEIAYASSKNGELIIFDQGISDKQILRKNPPVNSFIPKGFNDVAFVNEGRRVLASDFTGAVNLWDLRVSGLPQMVLTSAINISLNSIQTHGDQFVCGASTNGFIHTWDLRGGRSSSHAFLGGRSSSHAFRSDSEAHYSPLTSINLKSMLNKLGPLKPKANILQREIQSININPSCTYQLGFHLGDGCSGVFDMHNSRVSHIHCPPSPPWLSNTVIPVLPSRRPVWLEHSIYAVPSSSSSGLYLLDFNPHRSSPCHVDNDNSKSPQERVENDQQGVFVPLSVRATSCATHPFDGTLVVGTMKASLLMISQEKLSKKGDGDEDED